MRSLLTRFPSSRVATLVIAGLVALPLALAGCGGDDDNPTDPGPPGGGDVNDFDQATAIAQSQAAASEAVALVESMTSLADGLSVKSDKDYDYGWNEETMRWEYVYDYSGEGYVYDYLYTVQYLDADDEPQQTVDGAETIDHRLQGDSHYHYEGDGSVIDQTWSYHYNTNITGLTGDLLTMVGDGGYDWQYVMMARGSTSTYNYEVSWESLPPGITRPTEGGCYTGTVRYDFPPYYCLVVFDGTDTATATLYNENGEPVEGGTSQHGVSCPSR